MSSPSHHKNNIDLVCLSLQRWDAPVSSPALSLAKELSKTNRIFFIDHPFTWKDFIRERATPAVKSRRSALLHGKNKYSHPQGFPPQLTVVTTPLVYPVNFLPRGALYNTLSRRNNHIVLRVLREIVRENHISDFIFVNFADPFFLQGLPPDIRPLCYVYQCMDDFSQVAYTRRHGVALENGIISNADITLCTSRELTRLKSPLSPNVHFFPNAADTSLFGKAATTHFERPADLGTFDGKKIIGFTGSIEYRTDFELLRQIALRHDEKIIFLIGPVFGEEAESLRDLPNVVFAGTRKLEELPAYLQHFDCCIIPYKVNTLTRSIYPLKVNEYLAAGKPVVATRFSEDIQSFGDGVYLAGSQDAFIRAIDTAINEDDEIRKERRRDAAAANSWEARAGQLWDILNSYLPIVDNK